jgi:hypothetical protein
VAVVAASAAAAAAVSVAAKAADQVSVLLVELLRFASCRTFKSWLETFLQLLVLIFSLVRLLVLSEAKVDKAAVAALVVAVASEVVASAAAAALVVALVARFKMEKLFSLTTVMEHCSCEPR